MILSLAGLRETKIILHMPKEMTDRTEHIGRVFTYKPISELLYISVLSNAVGSCISV